MSNFTNRSPVDRSSDAHQDRSYFDDFSLWTNRSQGSSAWQWSLAKTGRTGVGYVTWNKVTLSEWGAAIHPRDKAQAGSGEQAVSVRVSEHNLAAGWGCGIGPAVNLKDSGAGNAPDGYYLYTDYLGGASKLIIASVTGSGTVFLPIYVVTKVVMPGDIITLAFSEAGTHRTFAYVNGEFIAGSNHAIGAMHAYASSDGYGICGVPIGTNRQELYEWWVSNHFGGGSDPYGPDGSILP